MLTNCYEFIADFLQSVDIPNLGAAFFSIIIYILSFLGPKNDIYIPPNDSNVNFPKSTVVISSDNIIFIYIIFFPLFLLILKLASKFIFKKLLPRFRYFTCVWISISSLFLSLSIANFLRYFIGFPKPDTYFICDYDFISRRCKKKIINKSNVFVSYPSFSSVIAMSAMSNLAFVFQFFITSLNHLFVIFLALGIFVGASNIKSFNSHPADTTAGLFIGFIIPYYFWNNSKRKIFIQERDMHQYQSIYN